MTFLSSKIENRILQITFEDKATRNSFSLRAARELTALIGAASGSGPRAYDALVLAARGRVFCSGGNLADYAAMTSPAEGITVNDEIRASLEALASLDVPTVCAVNGDCFGGGVELVSCFDHVIAAPHVVFGLWQRKISLTYGWGGGSRLERRLGSSLLRNLSLSARNFGAREALECGLVDELVSEAALSTTALKRAESFTKLPKAPIASFKAYSPEAEAELFNSLWWNETHQSILRARVKS